MEQDQKQVRDSEEIDLTSFFRWIGHGFRSFFASLLFFIATLRNVFIANKLFFAGIILLGLILGGIYAALIKKKYYKSTMVLSCDYLNTQTLENTIDKLNLLAEEPDKESLSKFLNIEIGTAKKIRKFEYEVFVSEDDVVELEVLRERLLNLAEEKQDVVDDVVEKLTKVSKSAYKLSVYVYDPDIVQSLETAIVKFFQNNPYIKRRIEITRENLLSKRNKLLNESGKLDSLKQVIYDNYASFPTASKGSGNIFLGDERLLNPLAVFTQDLELHSEIREIDKALYLSSDFEVVDGFTSFKEPDSANLTEVLAIAFLLSWLMGYLIIWAAEVDKKLAEYPTKRRAFDTSR